jgi:hypothetical protein
MKRRALFFSAVFTLIVTLFALVSPAFAKEQRSIKLVSVNYWGSKGVVFKFEVTGDFSPAELQGFVRISGHEFPLDCSSNDEGLLVCVAGDGIGAYVGSSVVVILNGQGFFTHLPQKKEFVGSSSSQYCYPIQGLMTDDIEAAMAALASEDSSVLFYWYPAQVGVYCTDLQPQNFDMIDFEHPYEAQLDEFFGSGGPFGPGSDITFAIFLDENAPIPDGELSDGCIVRPAYTAYMRLMLCSIPTGD